MPRRPLGPPHPTEDTLYLPWHPACRQYCFTDKETKTKTLEMTLSQAPNSLFDRGWGGVKSKERGALKEAVQLL